MNGYETWANLNRLARYEEPPRLVSREEWLRQERIAVGKICRCGDCLCCDEVKQLSTHGWNHEEV